MNEAEAIAKGDADARNRLMRPILRHAPVNMIDACAGLKGDAQKSTLMTLMGHRAIFDYELSTPRLPRSAQFALAFAQQCIAFVTRCIKCACYRSKRRSGFGHRISGPEGTSKT